MKTETVSLQISQPLSSQIELVADKCKSCGICARECSFLANYGNPAELAESYGQQDQKFSAFECSLCNLCTSVCPFGVDPTRMFLEMRREATREAGVETSSYKILRNYERRGLSPRFSYYGLPEGCDTVFFPGCSLPGTRPDKLIQLFHQLQENIPNLGIVLDCCTKPSHDLGDESFFGSMFDDLKNYLVSNNVTQVIVACTNCYRIFKDYGGSLSVTTAYEELDKKFSVPTVSDAPAVTIHDPCAVRFDTSIHNAVRSLIDKTGLEVQEMKHTGEKTICCGEGGAVGFVEPGLAKEWGNKRKLEADGRPILTYCAGCASYLNPITPTYHLLDLLFEPEAALSGKAKVSRSPITYFNRLKVKNYFQKRLESSCSRERPAAPRRKHSPVTLRRLALLAILVSILIALETTGIGAYF